jgi:hypothetical protein
VRIHDQTASIVAMARTVRDGLDMTKDHTSVRTATLRLLLDLLIDLGAQPFAAKRAEDNARAVEGQTISLVKTQEAFQRVLDAEAAVMEARING